MTQRWMRLMVGRRLNRRAFAAAIQRSLRSYFEQAGAAVEHTRIGQRQPLTEPEPGDRRSRLGVAGEPLFRLSEQSYLLAAR